jgi:hypothetical protein
LALRDAKVEETATAAAIRAPTRRACIAPMGCQSSAHGTNPARKTITDLTALLVSVVERIARKRPGLIPVFDRFVRHCYIPDASRLRYLQ